MNPNQAEQALFVLNGHWPNPKMEPPEVAVWAGYMTDWTTAEFTDAIHRFTLITNRAPFRPIPSQVAQHITAARRRNAEYAKQHELPTERYCTKEENRVELEKIMARFKGSTRCNPGVA